VQAAKCPELFGWYAGMMVGLYLWWDYHTCAVSDKCIDELNLDLQRVHEWAAATGLKLNPIKSQVIVINRWRAYIPPPTLQIGSDVIKVVPKVKNLGFVL
jgi:hypothetical protein